MLFPIGVCLSGMTRAVYLPVGAASTKLGLDTSRHEIHEASLARVSRRQAADRGAIGI